MENQIGTIFKSTGSWYQVLPDNSDVMCSCRLVGKLRLDDLPLTNPIAVGDKVAFHLEEGEQENQGVITGIEPRTNYVLRQSPRSKHELHMIAANIDQALIVNTIIHPGLKIGFIDRYLLTTEIHRIPVILVFNKADLYGPKERTFFEEIGDIYTAIGHTVILSSSDTKEGIDTLKAALKDKTTLLTGQSGVGKSTLINTIQPGASLRTGELSDYTGKGQHTTTFAEMFQLDFGGRLIDSPGLKSMSFNHFELEHIAHNFREFFALSPLCRFGASCMHENEPNCAVKNALETGDVSYRRYNSYLSILSETREQNHWERKKSF
jgi:ribosome biogenesis GTPase / thiamine phosphate phosphatase